MMRRLSGRVAKLEGKGGKDHFVMAADRAEAELIHAQWQNSPYARMPGHRLFVIISTMPPKDLNL